MGLEYLQLWADMEALFEPYSDEERGKLIMAMMAYAYRNEEPHFVGNERFIWPVLRQHIDRCAQNVEAKKAAGSKGGKSSRVDKQKETEMSESKQTEAETSKKKQEEAGENENERNAHTQYQYHDHDNDHDHTHKNDEVVTRTRASTPATTASDPVIGIDGTDLSESIRLNAEVDTLLRTYRLSEALRGDLLDDIAAHGLDKVKRVMHDAAQSDTKGGLSIKFIRACLANDGKPKPAARLSAAGRSERDHMQRHNYTKQDYDAMMMDLDA